MTASERELVRYRLQRAAETLEEGRVLAEAEHWSGCVNRLYYACFYAVSALLLKHGLSSAKHTGVRSLFNLQFVKTGRVPAEHGELYNELFTYRTKGDYTDLVRFGEDDVAPWIPLVRRFVEEITASATEELGESPST